MHNRLLRPLLIVEFLIALEAIFTMWSEVGGQYHLDLMFWPWKLGLAAASAGLIVAITANLVRNDGQVTRKAVLFFSFLIVTFVVAGVVTWYYHVNEPTQQDDDDDDAPARISQLFDRQATATIACPACLICHQVRQAFPSRNIGSPSLQPKALGNSGIFETVPLTRKRGMAWASVWAFRRSTSGVEFSHQIWP